jgi:hypothetical protein
MRSVMSQFTMAHSQLTLPEEQAAYTQAPPTPLASPAPGTSTTTTATKSSSKTSLSVSTYAGVANSKGMEDGPAASATFGGPTDIIEISGARYLILERNNSALRMIDENQTVTTLIGKQGAGFKDGSFESARLQRPRGLYQRKDGTIFIVDSGNHCIRALDLAKGKIKAVIGTPEAAGNAGACCSFTSSSSSLISKIVSPSLIHGSFSIITNLAPNLFRRPGSLCHPSLPCGDY